LEPVIKVGLEEVIEVWTGFVCLSIGSIISVL